MHIYTFTYGKIPIAIWEFPLLFFVLVALFLIAGYIKKRQILIRSEYRFFLWGLWAKIGGGLAFGLIYIFHYKGGDTTSFYECSLAFCNLFSHNFGDFISAYFGEGSMEMKSLFTHETGSPMWYMYSDEKTLMVIKLLVPIMLLAFKSYFLATILVAIFTYGGLWRLYLMFTSYFPQYSRSLALGILFMPSVIFWGSGILKDSFTLAATCYFIVATNDLITRNKNKLGRWIMLVASGYLILAIKPYILIILLPGTLVWIFYSKIKKVKNAYFRHVLVPLIYLIIISGSYAMLTAMSDKLGKFAPDKALDTAVVIQTDLKQEYYEGNSFDIGEFEATPLSIAAKAPPAVVAGLFRPFIWESKNVVMILSGLENTLILVLTIITIIAIRWRIIYRLIADYPVILYSIAFSLAFAFMIGLTTSNFGALVRFKIPLIPLYMGTLMVVIGQLRVYRGKRKHSGIWKQ